MVGLSIYLSKGYLQVDSIRAKLNAGLPASVPELLGGIGKPHSRAGVRIPASQPPCSLWISILQITKGIQYTCIHKNQYPSLFLSLVAQEPTGVTWRISLHTFVLGWP